MTDENDEMNVDQEAVEEAEKHEEPGPDIEAEPQVEPKPGQPGTAEEKKRD